MLTRVSGKASLNSPLINNGLVQSTQWTSASLIDFLNGEISEPFTRQVEFLLSSVLRERSCNLPGEALPSQGELLSDIERHIRQLELGHHTLGHVINVLKSTNTNTQYQTRLEVLQRDSREQGKQSGE